MTDYFSIQHGEFLVLKIKNLRKNTDADYNFLDYVVDLAQIIFAETITNKQMGRHFVKRSPHLFTDKNILDKSY